MKLHELVEKACKKDPDFKKKILYHCQRMAAKKDPNHIQLTWLMPHLERILGKRFCANAALNEIAEQKKEDANGKSSETT